MPDKFVVEYKKDEIDFFEFNYKSGDPKKFILSRSTDENDLELFTEWIETYNHAL